MKSRNHIKLHVYYVRYAIKGKEANKNDNERETNLLSPRLDDFAILRTD